MRTITLPETLTLGAFHMALVASTNKESSSLIIDGLRELTTGLNVLIGDFSPEIKFFNAKAVARDLLDMEHLLLLMLEDARIEGQGIDKQCAVSQLLDNLTGLRWEVTKRAASQKATIKCFMNTSADNKFTQDKWTGKH